MSMTYDEVVQLLSLDEPPRGGLGQRLDREDVQHLERIIREGHPQLSVKAALALSVAGAEGHRELVQELAADPRPVMRVAAARAAATLPERPRERTLLRLLDDDDAGVQKEAIRASATDPSAEVVQRLRSGSWRDDSLSRLADDVISRVDGGG
jgi:HEAT repeat protein